MPADRRQGDAYVHGIAIMACGVLPLPVGDAIGKYLATAGDMTPGQITFYRFFLQFALTAPVLIVLGGLPALRPARWWPNLLRGAFLAGASLGIFIAVKYMPLAAVIAIFFLEPLILTILSALVLHERVGWPRWLAIATGFLGAVIVINPSFSRYGLVAIWPVVSAALFAAYMLMNRALGRTDAPLTMQYAAGIGGCLLMAVVIIGGNAVDSANFAPSLPASWLSIVLLLCLGALAAYSHLLIVRAFQMAPASILAPFQYLEIVSATLLGYVFFDDLPTPSKFIGIGIIIASGLFVFWHEKRQPN